MSQTEKIGTSEETFFLDTYAIFEIVRGNKKYLSYKDARTITTIFNLAEFNYNLKKEVSKDKVDELTRAYEGILVDVELEDIIHAMDIKTRHRKLSIPDAIGYTIAKKYNAKFLTGDKDFKEFDNVEFVGK